jgi:hypothetical protein
MSVHFHGQCPLGDLHITYNIAFVILKCSWSSKHPVFLLECLIVWFKSQWSVGTFSISSEVALTSLHSVSLVPCSLETWNHMNCLHCSVLIGDCDKVLYGQHWLSLCYMAPVAFWTDISLTLCIVEPQSSMLRVDRNLYSVQEAPVTRSREESPPVGPQGRRVWWGWRLWWDLVCWPGQHSTWTTQTCCIQLSALTQGTCGARSFSGRPVYLEALSSSPDVLWGVGGHCTGQQSFPESSVGINRED